MNLKRLNYTSLPMSVYIEKINFLAITHIQNEICARHLPHVPSLRTCHPVKISNFEAHADMNIVLPQRKKHIITPQGHLPLHHHLQGFQVFEVRNVEMKR